MTDELKAARDEIVDGIGQMRTLALSMRGRENGPNGPSHLLLGIAHRLTVPFARLQKIINRLAGLHDGPGRGLPTDLAEMIDTALDELIQRHLEG